jgi:hypothetical protein
MGNDESTPKMYVPGARPETVSVSASPPKPASAPFTHEARSAQTKST